MERLIYSNSIPSSKHLHLNPRFLPPLARFDSPKKLAPFPSRLTHLSCTLNLQNNSSPIHDSSDKRSNLYADSTNGSDPNPHFINRVAQNWSRYQKVVNAGTAILLSAIFLTVFHSSLVPPALASFPNVVKAGGPASTGLIRSELLVSAWTGFFAGCLHTLSGPDHLAALAPLSIGRTKMESLAVGALWGCGHDAGQLIFGLLFLLLKDRLHIEVIRTWGTRVVGFTLLVIGGMGIREASEASTAYSVALENAELGVAAKEPLAGSKKKIGFATFATGIVHGLQPDALMMILPALALPSRLAGAAFLAMFLVGTVIAMGSYTVFIGSCSEALKDKVPRITEKLTWVSSMIAIALGLAILISQFFGFSLY